MHKKIWFLNKRTERGCSGDFEEKGVEVIILASHGQEVMCARSINGRQVGGKKGFPFTTQFSNLTSEEQPK